MSGTFHSVSFVTIFREVDILVQGRFFAMNEAKLIISILLRKYKLKPLEAPVFPIADRVKMPYGKFTIEKRLN